MENNFIWSDGIELALNEIKTKSFNQSDYHKQNYYFYKGYIKYFRTPTIILSGMNSVFSVGLQPYLSQGIISVLCCSISLICGIIASVELFLGLQNMMEKEFISSKEFYILSYDIFKILSVEREYRMLNGKIYLDNAHTKYCNLIERGNLLDKEDDETKNIKTIVNKNIKDYFDEKNKHNIKRKLKDSLEENIKNKLETNKGNFKDYIETNIKGNSKDIIKANIKDYIEINIEDNSKDIIKENFEINIEDNSKDIIETNFKKKFKDNFEENIKGNSKDKFEINIEDIDF